MKTDSFSLGHLTDEDVLTLFKRRTAFANWFGIGALAVIALGVFLGLGDHEAALLVFAAVGFVVFGFVYVFYLRPVGNEALKRGLVGK